MSLEKPFNIIVAGVGGQGVLSLARVIWNLCESNNMKCQGTTFKGGAQQLGSIHSELRIFKEKNDNYSMYSCQIPPGNLDLMIGLEPWETIRYHSYFGDQTKIYMNTRVIPIFTDRLKPDTIENPVEEVNSLKLSVVAKDFTKESLDEFKTRRMVNFTIAAEIVKSGDLPFSTKDFTEAFIKHVRIDNNTINKVKGRDSGK